MQGGTSFGIYFKYHPVQNLQQWFVVYMLQKN